MPEQHAANLSVVVARVSKLLILALQIESLDALPHLDEIIEASDAVMVARSDLGAQVPFENVPSIQVGGRHMYSLWADSRGGLLVRRPYLSCRHGRFFPLFLWFASHIE